MKAKIILEDGKIFKGYFFGATKETSGEVVFNTSLTGYQEIITDPSYRGQIVTMTYPLIGNYGINEQDVESRKLFLSGLIVKEASCITSNWRSTKLLDVYLKENDITGIEGIDTRALTRHIRLAGAMKAFVGPDTMNNEELSEKLKKSRGLVGVDLVKEVSCDKPYLFSNQGKYNVAVIDCGVKLNILRKLAKRNCKVTVFPYSMEAKKILDTKPDGILLSNGPGDPAAIEYIVDTTKILISKKIPIFGICLGHQILGLSLGGKTYKLKFGHHGGNHPVKDLRTGKISITSQNHGFCVDIRKLQNHKATQNRKYSMVGNPDIEITHINLNDGTCEGMRHKKLPVFGAQFHPEAAPGPHDSNYLFDDFIKLMHNAKK